MSERKRGKQEGGMREWKREGERERACCEDSVRGLSPPHLPSLPRNRKQDCEEKEPSPDAREKDTNVPEKGHPRDKHAAVAHVRTKRRPLDLNGPPWPVEANLDPNKARRGGSVRVLGWQDGSSSSHRHRGGCWLAMRSSPRCRAGGGESRRIGWGGCRGESFRRTLQGPFSAPMKHTVIFPHDVHGLPPLSVLPSHTMVSSSCAAVRLAAWTTNMPAVDGRRVV